ncbi:CTP synthetase [Candidatus Falkowbacteria bacterium]|nr:CTP synthetase [Candidatus Falkowbacteria bacterium]
MIPCDIITHFGGTMFRLFALIYTLAAPTLAGIFITALLTMNRFDGTSIIYAAAAGFLVGLPVAYLVAKQLRENA